jgi:chromosome segregation ATPase
LRIVDEILQRLRERAPLEEIKKSYRSQSQIYEALRIYMQELNGLIERKREETRKAHEDLQKVEDQVLTARRPAEEQSSKAEKLTQTNKVVDREIAEKKTRIDRLNAGVAELQSKGITFETLENIRGTETSSGAELVARVKTAALHEKLSS